MAKTTEEAREFTYTTAEPAYDYTGFGTIDHGVVGTTDKGKPVRMVSTFVSKTSYQRGRFGSGLHMCADDAEFAKLVSYGFVTLTAEKCDECGAIVPPDADSVMGPYHAESCSAYLTAEEVEGGRAELIASKGEG